MPPIEPNPPPMSEEFTMFLAALVAGIVFLLIRCGQKRNLPSNDELLSVGLLAVGVYCGVDLFYYSVANRQALTDGRAAYMCAFGVIITVGSVVQGIRILNRKYPTEHDDGV